MKELEDWFFIITNLFGNKKIAYMEISTTFDWPAFKIENGVTTLFPNLMGA